MGGFTPVLSQTNASQPTFSFGGAQSQQEKPKQDQQQSAGSGFSSLFGGGAQTTPASASPTPGFTFGQGNQSPPIFGFGNSNDGQSQSSIFGNSNNNTSKASEQQPGTSAFTFKGAANAQAQPPATSNFSFGGSTSTAPQQQSINSLFNFGSSTSKPAEQQPGSIFSFGAPQSDKQESSKPSSDATTQSTTAAESSKPAFSFGAVSKPTEQETSKAVPLFGAQPAVDSQPAKPSFSFGAPAQSSSEQPKSQSPFSFGQVAQAPAVQPPSTPATTFGTPIAATTEQQTATKPAFSFGTPAKPIEQPNPSQTGGFKFNAQSNDVAKSMFATPGQSTPNNNIFGSLSKPSFEPASAPSKFSTFDTGATQAKDNSPLSFGTASSAPTSETAKNSIFSRISAAPAPSAFNSTSNSDNAVSSEANTPPANSENLAVFNNPFASLNASSTTPSTPSIFAQNNHKAATSDDSIPSTAGKGSVLPPSNLFAPPSSTATDKPQQQSPQKKSLFGTLPQPNPMMAADKPAGTSTPPAAPSAIAEGAPNQRHVYTKSPARVPGHLNGEGYKEYDNNYRLRALNKEFKKKIASWDVDQSDIDNLIRHYVSARSAIGGDIGLYQRALAGTKRKNDRLEEGEHVPSQYKKVRHDEDQEATQPTQPRLPQKVTPATATPIAPKPISPAKATSLFNNMIPPSPAQSAMQPGTTPAQPASPFSGVSFMPESEPRPFSFGNTVDAGRTPKKPTSRLFGQAPSTTPQKSPPKSNLFASSTADAPTFGAFNKNKRKSVSEDEDEAISEDEARRKRNKPSNTFGNTNASRKVSNGPFIVDSDDDEDDAADEVIEEDVQDSDFAPNADESESEESDEGADGDVSDDPVNNAQQEESETSRFSDADEDHSQEIENNPNKGKSLFDRIEKPQPAEESTPPSQPPNPSSTIKWPSSDLTPEAPAFSPITPATGSPYKPATTFNFTPVPSTRATAELGASVLLGGATNGAFTKFDGMFGSRPSTPEPEKATRPEGPTSTPAGDHTWKQGSPIRFSANLVPPSPQPDKAATSTPSLFGRPTSGQGSSAGGASLGFGFGKSANQPSYLEAATHLAPDSGVSSGFSSRATSPGATDNESVATNDTNEEPPQSEPQQNLMDTRAGEENETVLKECRAKALLMAKGERAAELKMEPNVWKAIGVGHLRLLKHNDTGKVRLLLRADPGASIIINSSIRPDIEYAIRDQGKNSGAINGRFSYQGGFDHIVLKVKTAQEAQELVDILNEYKGVM